MSRIDFEYDLASELKETALAYAKQMKLEQNGSNSELEVENSNPTLTYDVLMDRIREKGMGVDLDGAPKVINFESTAFFKAPTEPQKNT